MSNEIEFQIDQICDEFEIAFRNGEAPLISDFRKRLDEANRAELTKNLVEVEIELTFKIGRISEADDYQQFGSNVFQYATQLIAEQNRDLSSTLSKKRFKKSERIGPYRLLQPIKEGGQGEVWKADQQEPIQRVVAIKIIRTGFENIKQSYARFEAEITALSMMDHPSIAKVLDSNQTDDGRPYFAMEFVMGQTLTDYCKSNQLDINERLKLFAKICDGVQHAHQKGIIHRDLKPDNILVTQVDGEPIPKIIDFGLAKAIQGTPLSEITLHTNIGDVLGTFLYMSPEQAESNELKIDTLTDIFSLGVILYELLTGSTPIEKKTLQGFALLQCAEYVINHDPERPSTRLSSMSEKGFAGLSPQRLVRPDKLKGDIDHIVMKAMEKKKNERYATCQEFAQDVRNYLNDEPIIARRRSLAYSFRKYCRRNSTLVRSFIAVLLLITTLAVILFVQDQRNIASTSVERLLNAKPGQLSSQIIEVKKRPFWATSELHAVENSNDQRVIRRVNLALTHVKKQLHPDLFVNSLECHRDDFADYCEVLGDYSEQLKSKILAITSQADAPNEYRLRASIQLLSWFPEESIDEISNPLLASEQPTLQTAIIHEYGKLGGSLDSILLRLRQTRNADELFTLVLLSGELNLHQASNKGEFINAILRIYDDFQSAGISAACEWCLTQLNSQDRVRRKRNGFDFRVIPTAGIRMVKIPKEESFWVGFPDEGFMKTFRKGGYPELSKQKTEYSFEISAHEVSVEQFFSVLSTAERDELFSELNSRMLNEVQRNRSDFPHDPMTGLHWYQVARFCNQLSASQNLQACYEIDKSRNTIQGKDGETIRPYKLRSNFQELDGYRLPTALEWECAARSGSKTLWHFGNDVNYVAKYDHTNWQEGPYRLPIGSLKPNRFGLFDFNGNVREWTTENADRGYQENDKTEYHKIMRGGSYVSIAISTITARETDHRPVDNFPNLGFRLVRVLETD